MSVLIRRVSVPVGSTVQVIPPDDKDHAGTYTWQVLNPTGSGGAVELVDAKSKTIGGGLPLAAGASWSTVADGDDSVFAAGPATGSAVVVIVSGSARDD